MFLLQALTPPGHEVILIDGNARAMDDDEIVRFGTGEQDRTGRDRGDDENGGGRLTACECDSRRRRAGRDGRTACNGMP